MEEIDYENDPVVKELIQRADNAEAKSVKSSTMAMNSTVMSNDANLVQYQLDVTEMLDKLEHFYKGDREGYDNGNIVWVEPEDEDLKPLNTFGVNSLMEIVTKYIDKNTSLSFYDEQRICEILADLGDEMVLFMFCNYEKMGMDTYFKKTKFRLLILTTLHLIESTYRRAFRGQTSKTLNETKIVTQTDAIGNRLPMQQGKQEFSIKNPKSWI